MKTIFFCIAFILFTGILSGQEFKKGSVIGFHIMNINLSPDVTISKWKQFAIETYLPALNKEFGDDATIYLSSGERGNHMNHVSYSIIFKSIEIRDKYYPEAGKTSNFFNTKMEKLAEVYKALIKLGIPSEEEWTDWVVE